MRVGTPHETASNLIISPDGVVNANECFATAPCTVSMKMCVARQARAHFPSDRDVGQTDGKHTRSTADAAPTATGGQTYGKHTRSTACGADREGSRRMVSTRVRLRAAPTAQGPDGL